MTVLRRCEERRDKTFAILEPKDDFALELDNQDLIPVLLCIFCIAASEGIDNIDVKIYHQEGGF